MRRNFLILLIAATFGVEFGCAAPSSPAQVRELEAANKRLQAHTLELEAQKEQLEAHNNELDARVKEFESRNTELADRLSPEARAVNLISPHYPPAVGGAPGWEYHQILPADLDSDGHQERVSVTTNAVWVPEQKEFGWDDGHPWHVYVEEADGTRTYLFSNWVQLGQLEVILDREGPGLFIVYARGGGLVVYRATYSGPGQMTTVEAFSIPLSDSATWANPELFLR